MKEATSQEKAVKSIEQTVEKAKVRQEINGLVQQWTYHRERKGNSIKNINCLTLPSKDWFYENGLVTALNGAFFLNEKPEIFFNGVEWDKVTAIKSFYNMPNNARLVGCCSFEDYLKYQVRFNRQGLGVVDRDSERTVQELFDFIWADYCGEATLKNIEDFAVMARDNIKEGLIAVTYKLNSRAVTKKGYIKRFKKYCKGDDLTEVVKKSINILLKKYKVNANMVYCVTYAGGEHGHSTMLTLVYSINVPKSAIIPIEENRRDMFSDARKAKYQIFNKLMNSHGWKVNRIKKTNMDIATVREVTRLNMAVSRWETKWGKITRDKKLKVATKYGKTLHQFGSMVAHYHGKLAEKA